MSAATMKALGLTEQGLVESTLENGGETWEIRARAGDTLIARRRGRNEDAVTAADVRRFGFEQVFYQSARIPGIATLPDRLTVVATYCDEYRVGLIRAYLPASFAAWAVKDFIDDTTARRWRRRLLALFNQLQRRTGAQGSDSND